MQELRAELEQKCADLQRCEAQLEKTKAHNAALRDSLVRYLDSQ